MLHFVYNFCYCLLSPTDLAYFENISLLLPENVKDDDGIPGAGTGRYYTLVLWHVNHLTDDLQYKMCSRIVGLRDR